MNTDDITNALGQELDGDDRGMLGHLYVNDPPLSAEVDGGIVRVVYPKSITRSVTITAIMISVATIAWLVVGETFAGDDFHLGAKIAGAGIGIGTVALVVGLSIWRHRHLSSQSPLIEVDKALQRVSILAGQHTFEKSDVVCLLALSACQKGDDGANSELQLVVRSDGSLERLLLATSVSSIASNAFGRMLKVFAASCDVPVMMAQAGGLFGRGEFQFWQLQEL